MDEGAQADVSEFDIITEARELEALAKDLLKEEIVAFDTEADSFYHYFDKTCLVQVATRDHAWLVDPLALGGPANLAPNSSTCPSTQTRSRRSSRPNLQQGVSLPVQPPTSAATIEGGKRGFSSQCTLSCE